MATFTPSVAISRALDLHAACYWPAGCRSAPRYRAMAGLLLCVDSLLNRRYLLVSGSVRVKRGVVGRLGLGLGLVLGLGLGLGLALYMVTAMDRDRI